MTANERNGADAPGPLLFSDAEAVAASGMPVPSLRVMQAAGAIQAQKTPKAHGGFRRSWREGDILIAAIGAAMSKHFEWNIRLVSEAMAKGRGETWGVLTEPIAGTMSTDSDDLILSTDDDWHLDLFDRKLLFLRVPLVMTTMLPGAVFGQTSLILGWVTSRGTFEILPWRLGNPEGRRRIARNLPPEEFDRVMRLYRFANACRDHALSITSVNITLPVRAAWRRLRGLEARFVQDEIP